MILFSTILLFSMTACFEPTVQQPSHKQIQAQKAQEAAEQISFTENAEIENIKRRLELTSQPGLMGYVILLNEMGQPVMYTTVQGKITSGSKRLTKPTQFAWTCEGLASSCWQGLVEAPSDEGTYGSSSPYIYFWTTSGQYIQWNGSYLYSDQPFRLQTTPLVIDVREEETTTK